MGEPPSLQVARANRALYDRMAPEFDATRRRPWAFVEEHLAGLPRGSRVLDAGCGNGRHVLAARERGLEAVGLDVSGALLRLGRGRTDLPLVQGDAFGTPFRAAAFDHALLVAAIHHLPARPLRREMLRELGRILRPNGTLLVTAWKYAAPQRRAADWLRALTAPRTDPADAWVPWRAGGRREKRFVHFYAEPEMREDVEASGFETVRVGSVRVGETQATENIVAVARKRS